MLYGLFPGNGPSQHQAGASTPGPVRGQVPELSLTDAAGAITILAGFTLILYDRFKRSYHAPTGTQPQEAGAAGAPR